MIPLLVLGCLLHLSEGGGCPLGYDDEAAKLKPNELPKGAKNHLAKWVCHICETCVEAGMHLAEAQTVKENEITKVFEFACDQLDKDHFKEVTPILTELCKGVVLEAGDEIYAKIKAGEDKICSTLKKPLCDQESPITHEQVDEWINAAYKREPELFNGPEGQKPIDLAEVEAASELFAKKRKERLDAEKQPAYTWPNPKKPTGKKGKKKSKKAKKPKKENTDL